MEKKCRKVKWLSEEALQIAVKRREVKGKGEKARYTQLDAEFQSIARTDKDFVSDQCKEIEENNRMGKTRDLFKKIRDTKGTFHAKSWGEYQKLKADYTKEKKYDKKDVSKAVLDVPYISTLPKAHLTSHSRMFGSR